MHIFSNLTVRTMDKVCYMLVAKPNILYSSLENQVSPIPTKKNIPHHRKILLLKYNLIKKKFVLKNLLPNPTMNQNKSAKQIAF